MIETWEADSLAVRVTVTDEATGGPLDLSSAGNEVLAENETGAAVVGTCTVEDPGGGILRAEFASGALPEGIYVFQVRVTIGAETQTVVSQKLRSRHSIEAAA